MACRRSLPKEQLTRLSRDADGHWQLDGNVKGVGGRGAWICQQDVCRTDKALRRFFRGQSARIAQELQDSAAPIRADDGGMNV